MTTSATEARSYDALFIVPANLTEPELEQLKSMITGQVTELGATINRVDDLGVHSFARPLHTTRERSGRYVRVNLTADPQVEVQIRPKFRLREEIVRMMITVAPLRTAGEELVRRAVPPADAEFDDGGDTREELEGDGLL